MKEHMFDKKSFHTLVVATTLVVVLLFLLALALPIILEKYAVAKLIDKNALEAVSNNASDAARSGARLLEQKAMALTTASQELSELGVLSLFSSESVLANVYDTSSRETVSDVKPSDSAKLLLDGIRSSADFDFLTLVNTRGYFYLENEEEGTDYLCLVKEEDYFSDAMMVTNKTRFTTVEEAPYLKDTGVFFSISIKDEFNNTAVLLGFIGEQKLTGAFLSLGAKDGSFVYYGSDKARFAAYYGEVAAPAYVASSFPKAEEGEVVTLTLDGAEYFASTVSFGEGEDENEWQAIYVASKDSIYAPLLAYSKTTTIFLIVIAVCISVLLILTIGAFHHLLSSLFRKYRKYCLAMDAFKKYAFTFDEQTQVVSFDYNTKRFLGLSKSSYPIEEMLEKSSLPRDVFESFVSQYNTIFGDAKPEFKFFYPRLEKYLKVTVGAVPISDSQKSVMGIIEDETDSELNQQRLLKKSQTDPLTELYNRETFVQMVDHSIEMYKGDRHALYLVDIDGFKHINDKKGHEFGDAILKKVSRSLQQLEEDYGYIVGRIGADVFGVFVNCLPTGLEVQRIASKMCSLISVIPLGQEANNNVSCSIGVSVYPKNGNDYYSLFQRADDALFKSKEVIGSSFTIYESLEATTKSVDDKILDNASPEINFSLMLNSGAEGYEKVRQILIAAMDANEFIIYAQPKLSSKPSVGMEAEALARWQSAKYGFVLPSQFIPMLEKTKLMAQFDLHILKQAFADLQLRLQRGDKNVIPLSVNQSLDVILSPDYIREIETLISEYSSVPTKLITLEVTERSLFTNMRTIVKILTRLREMGFAVSIDDFGAGYTTLSILADLPVDEIKIDKAFIGNGTSLSPKAKIVIQQIIEMAGKLGLKVVAEGVEFKEQLRMLLQYGCDFIQGFYIGKPMPIAEMYSKHDLGLFKANL